MRRPRFLIHWTGRDIGLSTPLTNPARQSYVQRLEDILEHGFWMTRPEEHLTGGHRNSPNASVSVAYHVSMTCFTELRLSDSQEHASSFGLLGVGIDRDYVLERYGSPVHYIRNSGKDTIVGAFHDLRDLIGKLVSTGASEAARALMLTNYLGTFFKGMSTSATDDFAFLPEEEWRIVVTERGIADGRIVPLAASKPTHRLPIPPDALRLVVFPDIETRELALTSIPRLCGRPVPLLTLDECGEF